jgi:hypothetical protein
LCGHGPYKAGRIAFREGIRRIRAPTTLDASGGQAAPLAEELPAAELVERIVSQAREVIARLGG